MSIHGRRIALAVVMLTAGLNMSAGNIYSRKVDTSIGTSGVGLSAGFNYPGAVYPGGMVQSVH